MEDREVIVNLWYVQDKNGIIYSLRVKAYVCEGSDEEKLEFLQQRARLDYLIADPYEIPKHFHIKVGVGRKTKFMPVAHVTMLQTLDSPITLFEDAIKTLESRMPAQSRVEVPKDPLVCTTPLMQNEYGVIEPKFSGQIAY